MNWFQFRLFELLLITLIIVSVLSANLFASRTHTKHQIINSVLVVNELKRGWPACYQYEVEADYVSFDHVKTRVRLTLQQKPRITSLAAVIENFVFVLALCLCSLFVNRSIRTRTSKTKGASKTKGSGANG